MTESKLDIDFVKENLNREMIISKMGASSLQALFTTVIIIGCFAAIMNVDKAATQIQFYIYLAIGVGVAAAILLAVTYYYGKITEAFQIIYTSSIDKDENVLSLSLRAVLAIGIGLAVSSIAYFFQSYGGLILNLTYCSSASTAFIYYIYRNNLTRWTYFVYALYGILTGTAAYGLGALVILAMGMIGFWLTIAILSLEVAFTAFYTYIGLLEWVETEKASRRRQQVRDEDKLQHEEAKEILGRLTP